MGRPYRRIEYETLYRLYSIERKSLGEIAKELKASRRTVNRELRRYGILVGNHRLKSYRYNRFSRKDIDKMKKLRNEKYRLSDIADAFGAERHIISKILKDEGVNIYPVRNNIHETSEMLDALLRLRDDMGRTPTAIEVDECSYCPSARTYHDRFGSFSNAITQAGLEPNNGMYGIQCKCEDGHIVRSISESKIDNWLYQNDIQHDLEPYYPNSNYRADWLIGGVYVEFFGILGEELYENKIELKREMAKNNGIHLIELYPKDLKNLDKKLGVFVDRREVS